VDGFLLNGFDFQTLHFHVEDLAQVHDQTLVDFLPQMRPEYLYERDFQGGYLSVHENTCQIELHLKSDVNVRAIYGGTPPKCEPTIWNLIQP
jgi:hypothetical protein